jgi:DNA polymerase-3 subunit alpha
MSFVHLHVHSVYSHLDGLNTPKDLARAAADAGQSALALTDHGNIGGAIRHYQACEKAGIKPILGMEVQVGGGHMTLLARDLTGYASLRALATAHAHGPLDLKTLAANARGLIALTGCILGHVPAALAKRDVDGARARLKTLVKIFGRVNVGVEIQFHGPLAPMAPALCDLAREQSLLPVATNDVHYLRPSDGEAQNVLMAIRQGKRLGDKSLFQHPGPDYWLKTEREMLDGQGLGFRRAVENAGLFADMCDVKLELGKPELPRYADDEDAVLARLADKMLEEDGDEYQRRQDWELGIIKDMGYSGYYLIVQDFVNWARNNGVAVGPGRGSGAGSLVAYALGITDLDPMVNKLFFERFLNPERVSMPDFDIDFSQAGREKVIDYVRERWGHDKVGQIATYIKLNPKSAIKDVARTLGMSFNEVNAETRVIPDAIRAQTDAEKKMSVFDLAMSKAPHLATLGGQWPQVLSIARQLTGCVRQMGKHPGGVVIGLRPLTEYTPLTADGLTAYDMKDVETVGLVKFDFLGVKTLDVIDMASNWASVNLYRGTLDDQAVYELMATGNTWGMFQIESPGMTETCRRLLVDCFNDVTAAVALYRPGPKESGMLDDYVARKHGDEPPKPPHDLLSGVLADTFGTIVYQEQVMQCAQILAGYSLGAADLLRRAMGKKIQKEMDAQRQGFVEGCQSHSKMTEDEANHLFDVIDKFAGYGFNRSHAAAYALVAYQTAWLKLYHPVEFTAALLSIEGEKQEVLSRYVREARSQSIVVLPPDVNKSLSHFTVEDGAVRWGLQSIKGLGEAQVPDVVAGRPYTDFFDLAVRSRLPAKGLKTLVEAGACDCFGTRPRHWASAERAVSEAKRLNADGARGQSTMFSLPAPELAHAGDWSEDGRLAREYSALGAYFSGHPMAHYQGHPTPGTWEGQQTIAGLIVDSYVRARKSDDRLWSRVTIEDGRKHKVVLVFADVYDQYSHILAPGNVVVFQGHKNGDEFSAKGCELVK